MKFYDDTKPLYLETDASRVGLGVALLQMHEGTACQKDVAPDNTTLHLIASANKRVQVQQHRKGDLRYST